MDSMFSLLEASPAFFVTFCSLLGLTVGSFLNVVIYRLPKILENDWAKQCAELKGEAFSAPTYNLLYPPSNCDSCGHRIGALENIPVLSYLLQGGKCRHCGKRISVRLPLIEAGTGLASGLIAWHFGFGHATAGALVFTWAMFAAAMIDFDTQLLPDLITLPLLWAGLLFNLAGGFTDLRQAVIGAVLGYLILWSIYWLFKLIAKKEGMGYGDFKLLAAIGAWLGAIQLPLVILLSSVVGAVIGILLIVVAGRGKQVPIPFGPYLVGGGLIAMVWGNDLVRAYLGQ